MPATNYLFVSHWQSPTHHCTTSKTPLGFGCWVVVRVKAKADYFFWYGLYAGSLRLHMCPLCVCAQHYGPFTAVQVALDQSIYRPLLPLYRLSLSFSIPADDEAYALIHGGASSTSSSTSLRPKTFLCFLSALLSPIGHRSVLSVLA